jgi:hypothetical protein
MMAKRKKQVVIRKSYIKWLREVFVECHSVGTTFKPSTYAWIDAALIMKLPYTAYLTGERGIDSSYKVVIETPLAVDWCWLDKKHFKVGK